MIDVLIPEPRIVEYDDLLIPSDNQAPEPYGAHHHFVIPSLEAPKKPLSRTPSRASIPAVKRSYSTTSIIPKRTLLGPTIPTTKRSSTPITNRGRHGLVHAFTKLASQEGARERILKTLQYFLKFFAQIGHLSAFRKASQSMGLDQLLGPLASQLSTFRKMRNMGLWLPAAREFQTRLEAKHKQLGLGTSSQEGSSSNSRSSNLYEVLRKYAQVVQAADTRLVLAAVRTWNCLWDDVNCMAKLTASLPYSGRLVRISFVQSSRAWMTGILLNMFLEARAYLELSTDAKDRRQKRREMITNMTKLGFDFLFCLIDVLEYPAHELVQTSAGLTSGLIGLYKIMK